MDRTFASGAAGIPPSAPASPSSGYPTAGNPGTGTPATKPGPWWFYMMTEEVRSVIVAAGLTPDYTNVGQLAQAIQQLISIGGIKMPVRAATTSNIAALAGGAPNTLDGVAIVANDRILVKDQTTGSQNGIYVVTTVGTGSNGTWSRAGDSDGAGELFSGLLVVVAEGTSQADSVWELATDGAITIGTTSLSFARKDSSAQGNFAGQNAYNASATLPAADLGKLVVFYGATAGQTLTLPAVAGVAVGKNYNLVNQASMPVTIKGNASENISRNVTGVGQTLSNTVVLNPGDSLVLSSNGTNQWNSEGQSAPDMFPNSLAGNGYQKLPNGLIVQWGSISNPAGPSNTPVTFPVAFTIAVYSVALGAQLATSDTGGHRYQPHVVNPTTTGMSIDNSDVSSYAAINWIAIGK